MARRLPAPPPALAGHRYVRPLGTGGFADVYLFEQEMPRRQVAVKVLLSGALDEASTRMFNAEADVMARLSAHPSIVTVYQASVSADGRPYLAMEYCPTSLSDRYRRERLDIGDVLSYGVRIGAALETAHRAGVLHRDIKPSNLLVTAFGAPVLADFGIASALSRSSRTDLMAMSVPWSAPEVIEERETGTVASEVWSLAATLYSLLAGRSPFEVPGAGMNGRDQLAARIRRARYTEIPRSDIPASLDRALRTAMSRDPAKRPASVGEFAHQLQLIEHELGRIPTALEVSSTAWTPQFTEDTFDDAAQRGPVRSTVSTPGRRQRSTSTPAQQRTVEGVDEGAPRTVSLRTAVIAAAGGAVVVAGLAVVAVLVIVGGS